MLAGREIEVGAVVAAFAEPGLTAAAPAEPTGS